MDNQTKREVGKIFETAREKEIIYTSTKNAQLDEIDELLSK